MKPLVGDSANDTRSPDLSGTTIDPVRILVVEDQAIVALYISDMLEDLSYDVCGVTESGADALDIAARERPALALVDIGLKGELDGIETARTLRERFSVPSLFMSGAGDAETMERANAVGARGFLHKPYNAAQLKAALDSIFSVG